MPQIECLKEERLFLASLQQTCNEYLYLSINKSKLALLLKKSSGFRVIWFIEASLLVLHRMVPDEVLRARLPFRYAKSALESRIQAYGRVKKG